ncbi:MAG: anaerobic ribonucleoside-triphosphate reductase activating protein [Bacteroidales bacterium]|nr:anaerobic ribonucleoside-triphosphate reductase activating protein [Bacteroidales bacterium]
MLKCYSYDIVCQEIPDEISLAVNISCCPNRCPGCHSPWLWEEAGEEMTEDMLTSLISGYSAAITCFCFMGGDAEPSEVERISRWIKSRWPHIKTAWYSGRAELPDGFDVKVLDYLKLGPYIEELGGLKSPDTNQVFYKVSPDGTLIKSHI